MRARARRGDTGAAVVDFVLMSVLLVMLLFGVLQIAVYFYARNVVAAAAADAARYAGAEGVDDRLGAPRAQELIRQGLGDHGAASIRCSAAPGRDRDSGLATATVHCHGHLGLVLLPWELPVTIDVTSSVLDEGQP